MMDPHGFEIQEIGEEPAPNEGLPDGCDLCGHCRMLSQLRTGRRLAIPCGGGRRFEAPFQEGPLVVWQEKPPS